MKHFYLWSILFFIPLGVFAQNYSVEEQNEIQAHQLNIVMEGLNFTPTFGVVDFGTDGAMENFIPTAGATQTFSPAVGDFFYDPGGPGGSSTGGSPGNYPNCGCITRTTLAGVSELEFTFFSVFGNFDWLKIYDGTDNTGTLLYNNAAGGANDGDITLADMIDSNGSATFTSTSGNFFFEFNASTVVDYGGWEVEILSGDGGDPTEYCEVTYTNNIEPITRVIFAGIDNESDPALNGSPAMEDFTSISGDVTPGESYEIALEGNTDGNFRNTFTVFIDWNQNGILDDAGEMYEAGTIMNSTGTDGQQALTDIAVPTDALEGTTRMRIIKDWTLSGSPVWPTDPCGTYDFGQTEDYTLNVTTGGSGGVDCGQGDDSNGFENGYQIGINTDFRNTDDFFVSADNTLNVQTIELNVLALEPIQSIDFTFRNDAGGSPGATVLPQTVTGLVPYDQVLIGGAFGYNVYALYVDVDIDFDGGAAGTTYWMQPQATAAGGATGGVFWEITSLGSLGSPVHTSELMGPWVADPDGFDAVFKLHCEDVDPPTPPCNFAITSDVEPISRVVVADIDNPSDPAVNGSPALEDFTSVEGHMTQGDSYDVAFEGNTGGNWTNYFTVFVDWNQNGDWTDDGEMFEIGSIANSTGTDGQQATGSITVPADALDGTTVMRVIKNFNVSPTNPCGSYSFGQAEDYTIIIGEGSSDVDCGQGDDSNEFENGYQIGIGTDFRNADDFYVSPDNTLTVEAIEINVISMGGPIDSIDFLFYDDNGGSPGTTTVESATGLIPFSQEIIGTAFGFDVYRIITDVELSFTGGATGTTYWMHPTATAAGGATGGVFWEITSLGTLGSPIHTSEAGGPWNADADGFDAVFKLYCEDLGASDMISSFDFAYYPNPVKDELNITSEKVVESVSVYNLAGQQVAAQKMNASQGKVNTSALTPGVYVFRVILQGGQVETFKIIKK